MNTCLACEGACPSDFCVVDHAEASVRQQSAHDFPHDGLLVNKLIAKTRNAEHRIIKIRPANASFTTNIADAAPQSFFHPLCADLKPIESTERRARYSLSFLIHQ